MRELKQELRDKESEYRRLLDAARTIERYKAEKELEAMRAEEQQEANRRLEEVREQEKRAADQRLKEVRDQEKRAAAQLLKETLEREQKRTAAMRAEMDILRVQAQLRAGTPSQAATRHAGTSGHQSQRPQVKPNPTAKTPSVDVPVPHKPASVLQSIALARKAHKGITGRTTLQCDEVI